MTALATLGTTVTTGHVRAHARLIDGQEACRVEACLALQPSLTTTGYVRVLLFVGVQRFFEADAVTLEKSPHGVPMPTYRPCLCSWA